MRAISGNGPASVGGDAFGELVAVLDREHQGINVEGRRVAVRQQRRVLAELGGKPA